MKQKYLLFFIGLLIGLGGYSQSLSPSVIATDGTVSKSQTISLEWTLGEVAVQTLRSSSGMITQGFHQPILKVEDLGFAQPILQKSDLFNSIQISVAPNPVKSTLHFTLESDLEGRALIQIVDLWGKTVQQIEANLSFEKNEIDLASYPAGMYLLYLRKKEGELIKTFKITKVN